MHELVTVDFCNVDRHLGLGRPGGCKGKDGYKGDAHAFPWHKDPPLKKSQFSQSDPLVVPILSTAWNTTCWVQRGQDGRHTVREARGAPPTRWPTRLVATAAEDRLSFPAIRRSPAAAIARTIAIYLLGRTHKPAFCKRLSQCPLRSESDRNATLSRIGGMCHYRAFSRWGQWVG